MVCSYLRRQWTVKQVTKFVSGEITVSHISLVIVAL